MNAGQHCWKACWGQPLRSSNLLSSATLTRENTVGGASRLALRGPLVSFAGLSLNVEQRSHRDSHNRRLLARMGARVAALDVAESLITVAAEVGKP